MAIDRTYLVDEELNVGESERWASVLLGGMITLAGLQRGSVGGAVLAGIGGALAFRGVSGHCPIFARLGMDSARPES